MGSAPIVMAIAATAAVSQGVPTFSTSIEVVYVDAFVIHDGQPVPGLTAADFELRDNGVRQTVALASLEEIPIVAVLVFDASTSVAGAKLLDLRAAGRAFLAGLRERDQAALVTFSHEVRVVVPQGAGRLAVGRALEELESGGLTSLWDALYTGLKLPISRGRPMVVLFSDGRDNASWLNASQVRMVAQESEAIVYVVAILPARDPQQKIETTNMEAPHIRALREVAEVTGGRLWGAGSSSQLERTFLRILAEMQARYLLSFTPTGVVREGWHRLALKLKNHKGSVRSRAGYMIPQGGKE